MGKDSRRYSFNLVNWAWYLEIKGGLDATSVSKLLKGARRKIGEKGEQDCLGQQAFGSLRMKKSEAKILLVQSFKEVRGDSTESFNSKSFQCWEHHKNRLETM
jgi:hypothetical protein